MMGIQEGAALRIRRVSTLTEWQKLQPHWDELLQDSRADAVFLCYDWLDTWLGVYGDGGQMAIILAEDEAGRLLGAAPMMLDRFDKTPGRWVRRLLLLGQKADTASEYLDWIVRRSSEAQVSAALAAYVLQDMAAEWDVLEFSTVRDDSVLHAAIKTHFPGAIVEFQTTSNYLTLPNDWDSFLEARRSKFRTRWRGIHRDHQVVLRFGGTDMPIAEGMERIRTLAQRRWGAACASFGSDRYVQFHNEIARRFQPQARLLLVFLEWDGQLIAGRYDFVYAGKVWCFQGGWLPEFEKQRAGKTLLTEIFRWAIGQGLTEYDFLGGAASYKDNWSSTSRTMVTIEATHPRSWRGKAFVGLRRLKRWGSARLSALRAVQARTTKAKSDEKPQELVPEN